MASKVSGIIEKINSDGISYSIASTAYGYCETLANEVIKDVDMTGFILYEGVTVHIKFKYKNSASNPKLRINSTSTDDAKPIVQYNETAVGTTDQTNGWYAGAVLTLTYDGERWIRDQGFNTNDNTYTSAYCSTAAGTAAKEASCTYWTATANSYIHITFRYTNTAANPTLNINSTGAKPIYIDGAVATTSNLKAGSYIAFYDGTNYYLRTDGKLPADISGNAETANSANELLPSAITIKTQTTQSFITLQNLMDWLISNQYIPSGKECYRYIKVTWSYKNNDILRFNCNDINYELQLAGCIIEFWGNATSYNTGVFRLGIHSSPATNFHLTDGYSRFPVSSYAEYTCNGSSYNPSWRVTAATTTNLEPTLDWNTTSSIGTVNGITFKVKTMAKPTYSDVGAAPAVDGGYVTSVNNQKGDVTISASDLGLSNALHFIGQATQTITNGGRQHPTTADENYSGTNGDVVIDKNSLREYVWCDGEWIMLGYTTSRIYEQPATNPVTNKWISKITQYTDGTIDATLDDLDTSGTWSGVASNVATTTNTSSTLYLIGVTGSGNQGVKRDSSIKFKGANFTAGNWTASTIAVAYGGTGSTSINKYGIIYGNSSQDAYVSTDAGDAGLVLIGNGANAAPSWYKGLTLSGAGTVASPYQASFGGNISLEGGLTLGDSDDWGDEYTPIYWNNGVPGKVTTILKEDFTLGTSTMSSAATVTDTITNNTSANSRVIQIVVTSGFSHLQSIIEWQVNNSNQIELSAITQGDVNGYILYIK